MDEENNKNMFTNFLKILLVFNWCSFLSKKYKQPIPSNDFLNGVRVQIFHQVKYLGVLLNASVKDGDDTQGQVKSLYCAANKI